MRVGHAGSASEPTGQAISTWFWQIQIQARLVRWKLESQIEGERWQQEAALDTLKAELAQAQRADQKTPSVPDKETAPGSAARPAHSRVEELARRYEIEERFLKANAASARARLRQREIQLERAHSLLEFKRRQVAGLIVRAGMDGTVLRIGGTERLQEGQAVTPNTVLATILQPAQLRAELAIPDSHSGEIQVGQPALIETHAGKVPGRVAGIDPAVAAATGTVIVYIALEGQLPKGVRPGSKVDGVIEIERLTNVLHMPRQASGEANQQVSLFKLVEGGQSALRVLVKLGRSSPSQVEVLDGLEAGDQVILSDMSSAATSSRIQLR